MDRRALNLAWRIFMWMVSPPLATGYLTGYELIKRP
jgi:hypothetical protein